MKRPIITAAALMVPLFFVFAGNARHFDRTYYFAEIPLVTTYSNGNTWTGWFGRWVDFPLMIDRSLGYVKGSQYDVTWPDFIRTLSEMKAGGMDGVNLNVSNKRLARIITAATKRGESLPIPIMPDYKTEKRDDHLPGAMEDEPFFGPAFYGPYGFRYNGKPVVATYWLFRANKDYVRERLSYLKRKFGDFYFVPNWCPKSACEFRRKMASGKWTAADDEAVRENLREHLRAYDGIRFSGCNEYFMVENGDKVFDTATCRRHALKIISEVYAEPEFKDKLFAFIVGMGHDNTYVGGQRMSSDGTRTLRRELELAYGMKPDFINFFEWDEWNENTGIRPTLCNSFAARRIVNAMKAKNEGRMNPVEPGDDESVPNVIVSFHKTVVLGQTLVIELLSVPDAAAKGTAECVVTLKDENGKTLKSYPAAKLDLEKIDEQRLKFDTADAGDSAAIVVELSVKCNGETREYPGLPFVEVRPTANWDSKWTMMPIRDLLPSSACAVRMADPAEADGKTRVEMAFKSSAEIDRFELTDGGEIIYSHSGNPQSQFREDDGHYVFQLMQFCSIYTQKGGDFHIEGVKDAEWLIGMERTKGMSCKIYPQAEFTPDVFLKIRKDEIGSAVVRLDWRDMGDYRVPLKKVVENGDFALCDKNGFSFSVHRSLRQMAFFDPVNAKKAKAIAELFPDLPVSVLGAHIITAGGKIFRSKPFVIGRRSGKLVPIKVWDEMCRRSAVVKVDEARLPRIRYAIDLEHTGTIVRSGAGRAFDGSLGGSTCVATLRNRGGDSRQHCCAEKRRGKPSRCPKVAAGTEGPELVFDGSGTYFVMPGGFIPWAGAFRLSFEFKPEATGKVMELFGNGSPDLWGTIGYVKLMPDGTVKTVGLSKYETGDAYVNSNGLARFGEWNRLEIVSDVDTLELVLNGKGSGKVPLGQPGRCNSNSWFGGRAMSGLYRGSIRNVKMTHGNLWP